MSRVKPIWRGVSHQYAFFGSLVSGAALVWIAPSALAAATAVYAASVTALFGTSAAYHRIDWSEKARMWMRRLDHSMIFLLIAGTYTPFAVVGVGGPEAKRMLFLVWVGSALGICMQLFWPKVPKALNAMVYVAVGWVGVSELPLLIETLGLTALGLVGVGGVLYTTGAIVYALRRPDPWPQAFGYHEIFHALVIAAAILHFTAVAMVLARA